MTETRISITPALEDCLEAMLELRDECGTIRVTDVAGRLGVAKPTVTQAVNRLRDLGLVRQENYGHAELTDQGLERADTVRNRHRLLRIFLSEVLGADLVTADREACAMEHALGSETIARIEAFTAGFTRRTAKPERTGR
jgi:DtxR family transcriptional regulator, Mn-dependent transcriptional regulator